MTFTWYDVHIAFVSVYNMVKHAHITSANAREKFQQIEISWLVHLKSECLFSSDGYINTLLVVVVVVVVSVYTWHEYTGSSGWHTLYANASSCSKETAPSSTLTPATSTIIMMLNNHPTGHYI